MHPVSAILVFSALLSSSRCCLANGLTCNGRAEFCDLTLTQATFAGTHNSGAGFDGILHYHTFFGSVAALSCFYRNQGESITRQLDDGIRYLDIDTCWESSSRWHVGAWSCHEGAYAGTVFKILNQIDAWMNKNRNEVVVIHFNRDTDKEDASKIGPDIAKLITERWGPTTERRMRNELMVNDRRRRDWKWPTLRQAVQSNQRIFVFFDYKLFANDSFALYYQHHWMHSSGGVIGLSWKSIGLVESKGCSKLVEYIRDKCGKSDDFDFMQIDLTLTWGLCVDDMANYCNRYADQITRECAERRRGTRECAERRRGARECTERRRWTPECAERRRGARECVEGHRMATANFISVDWQSRASGRNKLRDVARRQNIRNVKYFLGIDISE